LHFHQFTGDGDAHNDLLMNRDGKVFTVSVSSIQLTNNSSSMTYLDIQSGNRFNEQIVPETSMAGR
jgi:hypothetical protein